MSLSKNIIFTILALIVSVNLHAQRNVKMAQKYFDSFDFIQAIDFYKKVLEKEPDNLDAIRGVAYSYKHLNNNYKSVHWFEKLVDLESDSAMHLFELAQAQRSNQSYDEALVSYNTYMTKMNEEFVNNITGNGFEYIEELKALNPEVVLKNAEPLNSKASDFGVSFKRYNEIVYCSTREESQGAKDNWTHEKYADLYESSVSFNNQKPPEKFENNIYNGIYHDGPAYFYKNEMYLTRSNYSNKKYEQSKEDKTVKLQIHQVDLTKSEDVTKKTIGEKLAFNGREFSIAHATLSPDGKTMVFATDASSFPEHIGGTDLYITFRNHLKGEWKMPKSLGALINTPGDEEYPFLMNDSTLYFASNGHYGLGGLDIYVVEFKDTAWTNLTNIGAPFNTSFDDLNYIFNPIDNLGFITSNRDGGFGSDDIYIFKTGKTAIKPIVKKEEKYLNILVYDQQTSERLKDVKISIPDCFDQEWESDEDGEFQTVIDEDVSCTILLSAIGYDDVSMPFTMKGENLLVEVPMHKTPVNQIDLAVCVYDQITQKPIPNATVTLSNIAENRMEKFTTDKNGCVLFKNLSPEECYQLMGQKIQGEKSRYLSTTDEQCTLGVKGPAILNKELFLLYGEMEKPFISSSKEARNVANGFVWPIIYYDLAQFDIRRDAVEELKFLLKVMKDNPTLKMSAHSHTDCRRDEAFNMELSKNRAIEAVDWLVENGISKERLTWQNNGESQHVNTCDCECEGTEKTLGVRKFRDCEDAQLDKDICTEDDHQLNRRTEFVVVSF